MDDHLVHARAALQRGDAGLARAYALIDIAESLQHVRGIHTEPLIAVRDEPDEMFRIGAKDWTKNETPFCGKFDSLLSRRYCTREPRHPGKHVCGDGSVIQAVWE